MSGGMIELPLTESIQVKNVFILFFFHIFIMEPWGISDSADDACM